MNQLGVYGLLLCAFYILVRQVFNYFKAQDVSKTTKRITLLDTVIEAKNIDIVKDQQDVKEKSDAYEKLKSVRSTPPNK